MDRDSNYWEGWWRRRTSRRTVLRAFGGLSVAGVLSACAPSQSQTTQPQQQTGSNAPATAVPTAKPAETVPQILRHANQNPPVTLDPNGTALSSSYFYAIYDALTRIDPEAKVFPGLAESWKPVDDNTWEFKLRTAKWSDGSNFTADDVKFTYDHVLTPSNKSAIASRIANVQEVTVVDPRTVRIITKGPDPLMAKRAFFVPILPKAYIEKVGMESFSTNPIGTGGFKIKEYQQGTKAILVRSETSWRKPKLTELHILEVPDATARLAGLRTGTVDMMDGLDIENAERVRNEPGLTVVTSNGAGSYNFDLEYFTAPYNDVRVRLAINHAIDKAGILKGLLKGFGNVMDGQIIPKNVFGYNPNLKPLEYDPKKAKELLAAAGVADGFPTAIEFTASSNITTQLAQAMQQQLKDVGIQAELKPVEVAVWRDHIYNGGRPPIFWNPWSAQAPLDAEFIFGWYGEHSFNNKPYWKNQKFFDAYAKSQTELDEKKRLGYLQAASVAMHEDPPVIFSIQTSGQWGVSKKVKGFVANPSSYVWYDDIEMVKA